jgi:3-hydroxyisobutyrate dehydrogenase
MASIGFIGVGNMGGPMALNLIKAGHQLKIYDVVNAAAEKIAAQGKAQGSEAVSSPSEAVLDAEVLISMLPSGQIVEDLYLGEDGLLASIDKKTLVIDCSTIAPENARRVADAAKAKNIRMIDAPVSGGTAGAAAGSLTFICGGEKASVDAARPFLEIVGSNIFHAGESGAGQVAKICNNMLLAVHMIGTAESLKLGVDNGLDPKVLSEIMLKSSGRNWSLELYNPYPGVMENVPSSNNYQGGFMVDLMNKDLGLAVETAVQSRSSTPMGSLAKNLFGIHSDQGKGKLDFSSILQLFKKQ